jgi:hypothetical protein
MNTKIPSRALLLLLLLLAAPTVRAADDAQHEALIQELAAVKAELAEIKAMIAGLQDALAYCVAGQSPRQSAPVALPQAFGAGQPSRANYQAPGAPSPADAPEGTAAMPAAGAPSAAESAAIAYTILREWGRSPSQAAELGEGVTSLKGMVIVVPPGVTADYLDRLGRDLHTQYSAFDNINIEVFDDPDAAEAFTQSNVANPAHRVLSISKHKASGRDVVLRTLDGITLEVPF